MTRAVLLRTACLGLLALHALVPGAVAAQGAPVAAFLPGPAADTADPEQRLRALATVRETLEAQGVRTLGPDAVRHRLRAPLRECARTECAPQVAQAVGADMVAAVAVWAEPPSVAISLVTPGAHVFSGTAPVEGDDWEAATGTALATALRRQRLGPGPWLHVHGGPAGAQVLLDGTPVGVLPHRTAITPGRHVVQVRLRGHRTFERTVDVPLRDQEEVDVHVRLVPGGDATRSATRTAPPPRRALGHRLGALTLGATGAGLLAGATAALMRQRCGMEAPQGGCLRGRRIRPLPFGLYVAGGLAAGLGAILWITLTRPRRPRATQLGLTPFGLHLRRHF